VSRFVERNRWVWSLLAVLLLWAILSVVTSRFSLQSLSGVAISASFLTIVGLGQMLVVTTGRGNIDLSVASVITLSAYASMYVDHGQDARLPLGIGVAVAIGLVAGAANAALVAFARIPAIIATLATGYMLATATLFTNRVVSGSAISPSLRAVAIGRAFGVPVIALVALAAVLACWAVLRFTVYGRKLSAVGQNERAAALAGVPTRRVTAVAFLACSLLAACSGLLLSAYVGGAFLEMGAPFVLQSLGAVVLGGTLIFGGAAVPAGTLFGSLLLVLIVTTMQIAGLPPGMQDVVQGIVIITVLGLAGGRAVRRAVASRRPRAA
jgi:ribose transport system permease protein